MKRTATRSQIEAVERIESTIHRLELASRSGPFEWQRLEPLLESIRDAVEQSPVGMRGTIIVQRAMNKAERLSRDGLITLDEFGGGIISQNTHAASLYWVLRQWKREHGLLHENGIKVAEIEETEETEAFAYV
jgi:hypothetical protein